MRHHLPATWNDSFRGTVIAKNYFMQARGNRSKPPSKNHSPARRIGITSSVRSWHRKLAESSMSSPWCAGGGCRGRRGPFVWGWRAFWRSTIPTIGRPWSDLDLWRAIRERSSGRRWVGSRRGSLRSGFGGNAIIRMMIIIAPIIILADYSTLLSTRSELSDIVRWR